MQERSSKRITKSDLQRLGEIAKRDLESLFERRPETGRLYRNRLLAIVLCQGAALHYHDGKNGVKDFDVWSFFRANPRRAFPCRRNASADFGIPKFGKTPGWRNDYIGRRVDLLGRSLPASAAEPAEKILHSYLSAGRSVSARKLAEKAMVIIHPKAQLGRVIWPAKKSARA